MINISDYIIQHKNPLLATIAFIIIFILIYVNKPSAIFIETENGYQLREFGIGYEKKTIFPLWIVSIWIAIIVYFLIYFFFSNYYSSLI
jgi:uncharacterized membrane protein YozB (DUF420 family)